MKRKLTTLVMAIVFAVTILNFNMVAQCATTETETYITTEEIVAVEADYYSNENSGTNANDYPDLRIDAAGNYVRFIRDVGDEFIAYSNVKFGGNDENVYVKGIRVTYAFYSANGSKATLRVWTPGDLVSGGETSSTIAAGSANLTGVNGYKYTSSNWEYLGTAQLPSYGETAPTGVDTDFVTRDIMFTTPRMVEATSNVVLTVANGLYLRSFSFIKCSEDEVRDAYGTIPATTADVFSTNNGGSNASTVDVPDVTFLMEENGVRFLRSIAYRYIGFNDVDFGEGTWVGDVKLNYATNTEGKNVYIYDVTGLTGDLSVSSGTLSVGGTAQTPLFTIKPTSTGSTTTYASYTGHTPMKYLSGKKDLIVTTSSGEIRFRSIGFGEGARNAFSEITAVNAEVLSESQENKIEIKNVTGLGDVVRIITNSNSAHMGYKNVDFGENTYVKGMTIKYVYNQSSARDDFTIDVWAPDKLENFTYLGSNPKENDVSLLNTWKHSGQITGLTNELTTQVSTPEANTFKEETHYFASPMRLDGVNDIVLTTNGNIFLASFSFVKCSDEEVQAIRSAYTPIPALSADAHDIENALVENDCLTQTYFSEGAVRYDGSGYTVQDNYLVFQNVDFGDSTAYISKAILNNKGTTKYFVYALDNSVDINKLNAEKTAISIDGVVQTPVATLSVENNSEDYAETTVDAGFVVSGLKTLVITAGSNSYLKNIRFVKDGVSISNTLSGTTLTTSATSESVISCTLITAVYDGDRLVACDLSGTITLSNTASTVTVDVSELEAGTYTVKTFICHDMTDLIPVFLNRTDTLTISE